MEQLAKFKTVLGSAVVSLFALIVFGLIWFFFLGPETPVGLGWYLFSFAAGLTMVVLPCTLPLAFVIVPLSMGKGAAKGIGMAVAFGLGVAITLSMYGVIAALIGEVAIGTLGAPLEAVKNWLYFIAGAFAFAFALGEIGLVNFHMPTYTGAAPAFIQKQGDYLKALLLGLFLGNIGVGCPHPATPVILTRIAASGDVFYGWLLFFVHAVGRILPLLLLAFLAILGINALTWLIARKDKIERATGWGMVFVAAFILVLGLFTHDWWVYSGQHSLLEELTGEEYFLGVIINRFNLAGVPHGHDIPTGTGLLGLPLWLGNWVLVGLWVLPMWWHYRRSSKFKVQSSKLTDGVTPIPEGEMAAIARRYQLWFYLTLSALLALTFIWVLPDRFLNHRAPPHMEAVRGEMVSGEMGHAAAPYHEEGEVRDGLAVNLNLTPVPVRIALPVRLDFFVNEKPDNVPVVASELELDHTKLMHVISIRRDMNEFFHIHPEPGETPGILTINHTFDNPGLYKIWSEVKKDGVNHVFGHPEFGVEGGGLPENKQVSFGRNAIAGNYQVSLKLDEPVAKGHEHDLVFDIHAVTGEEVEIEDYLGAKMHLTLIKDDWKQFIHTHPEEGGDHRGGLKLIGEAKAHIERPAGVSSSSAEDEVITFHAIFPEAGLYKAFAQFRPVGANLGPDQALTVSFWIEVQEKRPLAISPWWISLIASAILILVLSRAVRRYLMVKG